MLQIFSYIENASKGLDQQENKLFCFIESGKLEKFKALKKKIEVIIMKDIGISTTKISNETKRKLTGLMTCALFEEEYNNNIVNNILKPYYERPEMKDYLAKGNFAVLFVDYIKMLKLLVQNVYIHFNNDIRKTKFKEKKIAISRNRLTIY